MKLPRCRQLRECGVHAASPLACGYALEHPICLRPPSVKRHEGRGAIVELDAGRYVRANAISTHSLDSDFENVIKISGTLSPATLPFPSPRPSPQGRGRMAVSPSAYPAWFEISSAAGSCSLSSGVRGKAVPAMTGDRNVKAT